MKNPIKTSVSMATLALALGAATVETATAAPALGFDPYGSGGATAGWFYADIWSDFANSGVAQFEEVGGDPTSIIGNIFSFQMQYNVSGFQLDGAIANPPQLNATAPLGGLDNYELTQEFSFLEVVTDFEGDFGGASSISFGHQPDDFTNLTYYFDKLPDGSGGISGNGGGTVRCYGSGDPSGNNDCGDGTGDGDGTAILEANLVKNVSRFDATGATTGTGSFDLTFAITDYDPNYITVDNRGDDDIASVRVIGNLTRPEEQNPDAMWNGVPAAGNLLFAATVSKTYETPVPGTLALMGLALAGFGATSRLRKAKRTS